MRTSPPPPHTWRHRRPDLRNVVRPKLSGAPLSDRERDHDLLTVESVHASHGSVGGGVSRLDHVLYDLKQTDVGSTDEVHYFKAVKYLAIRRVPRWLRQLQGGGTGTDLEFPMQRDMLAAMHERDVKFLNLIYNSPDEGLSTLFLYGVQATGATAEDAITGAGEAYEVMERLVEGSYQQIEYTPLTSIEADSLIAAQRGYGHLAIARGKPTPTGMESIGAAAYLDGNRTDAEEAAVGLNAILRGLADRNYLLTLLTLPIPVAAITSHWRNLSRKLGEIRSDQSGTRSVNASVAVPFGFGAIDAESHGNSHSTGESAGLADAAGVSASTTDSTSASVTETVGSTVGSSESTTEGMSESVAESIGQSEGSSVARGVTEGTGLSDSLTLTEGTSSSLSESAAQSTGTSQSTAMSETGGRTASTSESTGITSSESASVSSAESSTVTQSQTSGLTQSVTGSATAGSTLSDAATGGTSTSIGGSQTDTSILTENAATTGGGSLGGGLPGLGGQLSSQESIGTASAESSGDAVTGSVTGTSSSTVTSSDTVSQGVTQGESLSTGAGQSGSQGATLAQGASAGSSQSLAVSAAQTASQATTVAATTGQNDSASVASGATVGQASTSGAARSVSSTAAATETAAATRSDSATRSAGESRSLAAGRSNTVASSEGTGTSAGTARADTAGSSAITTEQQAVSDAYLVALSQSAQQVGTLGVVPSFGVSKSMDIRNEDMRLWGDLVEAQVMRLMKGIDAGGAFLYSMTVTAPTRRELLGAAGLVRAAFWGPGSERARLPVPFHVVTEFGDPDEYLRLRAHAAVLSTYRKREEESELLIEPFKTVSYATAGELASVTHPPTAEAAGIAAVADGPPVFRIPPPNLAADMHLGHIYDGERAKLTPRPFALESMRTGHTLIAGRTQSGKTTTSMRLLKGFAEVERDVRTPEGTKGTAKGSILALDWMNNLRDLANIVDPTRFTFYSIAKPELGAFRWNVLAVPSGVTAVEWLDTVSTQLSVAWGLGDFGRSLIFEAIEYLYAADRSQRAQLRGLARDDKDRPIATAVYLNEIDQLPESSFGTHREERVANVFTDPELSRCIGLEHLAVRIQELMDEMSTPEGARKHGTAMRDRIQSLWRRLSYVAPGSPLSKMLTFDKDPGTKTCLTVNDLVDPDSGRIVVVEADGLDHGLRRLVIGSVLLAVWRWGQVRGAGVFNQGGQGPGLTVVLEEFHELLGEGGAEHTIVKATELYEGLARRSRALGMQLQILVQEPGLLPDLITGNMSTVIAHRIGSSRSRDVIGQLMNWERSPVGGQLREHRWLGEQPRGFALVRMDADEHFLDAQPVQIVTDPLRIHPVSDRHLRDLSTG